MMWTLGQFLALWVYTGVAVGANLAVILALWLSAAPDEAARETRTVRFQTRFSALPRVCHALSSWSLRGASLLGFSSRHASMFSAAILSAFGWPWLVGIWFEIWYEYWCEWWTTTDTDSES